MDSEVNRYEPPVSDVAMAFDPVTMELAGRGRRFATFVIDYIGIYISSFLLGIVVAVAFGEAGLKWLQEVPAMLLGLAVFFVYYLTFEGLWARTPGKWLLGTVAVDESGRALSFRQAIVRTACRFIPFEALSFFGQLGWHDSMSKTRVVRTRRR